MTNNQWNTFDVDIDGNGSTQVTLTSNGRLWLNEMTVKQPVETGIGHIALTPGATAARIYTLSGTYAGTRLSALPKGIYIVNGKKVVK